MKLDVAFDRNAQHFAVAFSESGRFKAGFGQIQAVTEYVGGDPYSGAYEITPKVEAQTMPTKNKVMVEDVTVKAIPVYRVSNTSGGTTVYIAKEV